MSKIRHCSAPAAASGLLVAGIVAPSAAGAARSAQADSGTVHVATTTETAGATQYIAGFNADRLLGRAAITYLITTIPTSTEGTVTLQAREVHLYTGTGELSGSASATLTAGARGSATISGGKLNLTAGAGILRHRQLTATFTGTGSLASHTYTFHYAGILR